jgi:hypothetical protein
MPTALPSRRAAAPPAFRATARAAEADDLELEGTALPPHHLPVQSTEREPMGRRHELDERQALCLLEESASSIARPAAFISSSEPSFPTTLTQAGSASRILWQYSECPIPPRTPASSSGSSWSTSTAPSIEPSSERTKVVRWVTRLGVPLQFGSEHRTCVRLRTRLGSDPGLSPVGAGRGQNLVTSANRIVRGDPGVMLVLLSALTK